MNKKNLRPSFATIDLSALAFNFSQIRKQIGKIPQIMGIVKANAYGHGSVVISKFLESKKIVSCFGVAFVEEGVELRNNGIKLPILALTHPAESQLQLYLENNIEVTICDLQIAKKLNSLSKKFGIDAIVHLKIDTGMGRIGIKPSDAKIFFDEIYKLKFLKVKGIFTHFSSSDDYDLTKAKFQLQLFNDAVKIAKEIFGNKIIVHAANSGAVLQMPNSYFDMVRPGIIIYGYYPISETRKTFKIKSVMRIETEVVFKKSVPKNTSISYSGLFTTTDSTDIVSIPFGYADGYPRLLTNKTEVLIKGKKYKVVGRICMDQMMIDVGKKSKIKVGEKVILVGKDKTEFIGVDELTARLNNLSYEMLCGISPRVPRVYKNG